MSVSAVHDSSLTERVLAHSRKRKRLTISTSLQPTEVQQKRLCDFVRNSLNSDVPATGEWPQQDQWAELALEPLFRESANVWCKRSKPKGLQSALEKICVTATRNRQEYVNDEIIWWQEHRKHLINHEKPWTWADGSENYVRAIRDGCTRLLIPVSELKSLVKRKRLEEYKERGGDDQYTDGMKTCTRCHHRTIVINTSTCLNGQCAQEFKAETALRKKNKVASTAPEAIGIKCEGNSSMAGCGCVVFALPGESCVHANV